MLLTSRRSVSRGRRAFTLAEILIAVAIMAIAGAMVIPVVFSKIRASQVAALSQTYAGLSQGIAEFKRATTRYPLLLSSLSATPAATDDDICGNDLTATNVALWRGPYASRQITTSGVLVGEYTIQNSLRRVAGTPVFLMIDAGAVSTDVVDDLESQLDAGSADGTTGTIRYTTAAVGALGAAPSGTYNVSYAIPINSC
jgi:prepilin-type N-terminal cleavage/methylation domain-containing protein